MIPKNQGIDTCLLAALGSNIRAERCRKGYSQEVLAEKSGLHRTYIGVVERGEKNITIFNCSKIAHALQLTLSDLIRRAEDSFFGSVPTLHNQENCLGDV